jgi:hypothetical protein
VGEKFDTPTGVMQPGKGAAAGQSQGLAVDMTASSESTTTQEAKTQEKPGTGRSRDDDQAPDRSSSWSGGDKYPDGYEMKRHPDGSITLTDPDGEMGIWQDGKWVSWRTGAGDMPEGWGGGHEPGKG